MADAPPPSRRDPNGPTWRNLALATLIVLIAVLVIFATLALLPGRPVPRVGLAYSTEQFPGSGSFSFDPQANISLPSGASLTSVAANYSIGGGYRLNLTVGWCLPGFPLCAPPPAKWFDFSIYQGVNRSAGAFGWVCDQPYSCMTPVPEMWVLGAPGQPWTLCWEVVYNYTATEPTL